jgi:hypothetical protein
MLVAIADDIAMTMNFSNIKKEEERKEEIEAQIPELDNNLFLNARCTKPEELSV